MHFKMCRFRLPSCSLIFHTANIKAKKIYEKYFW
jgi:hypothetical protein